MYDTEKFWARVDITPHCWEWQGGRNPPGYGRFYVREGWLEPAHRVSYKLCHGPIPEGLIVRHRCDNPPCVNPDHLELGTHKDNSDDKISRGRHAYGERNGKVRIPDAAVLAIRESTDTQVVLAQRYGVTQGLISLIKNGKRRTYL